MMTCGGCGTTLDAVPVGTPCPKCGSLRRDATVNVPTVRAVGRVHAVGVAIGHDTAMPITPLGGRRTVVEPRQFTLEYLPAPEMYIALAWLGDDLIGMGIGTSPRLALFAISHDIRDALTDDGS